MTITVTTGNTPSSSIASNGNSSAAASHGTGDANNLFALLFSDAQLGAGENVLLADPSLPAHLQALLTAQGAGSNAQQALLVNAKNPRLALDKKLSNNAEVGAEQIVDDLINQIKGRHKDTEKAGLLADETSNGSGAVLAQITPNLIAKPDTNSPLAEDSKTTRDELSGKKGLGLFSSLSNTTESTKTTLDELATSHAPEKTNGADFSQQLSQSLSASKGSEVDAKLNHTIHAPVHDQQAWPKQLGDRVVWMTQQGQQTAEIHLNPAQLGPLQITLNLTQENATAVFVSQHAEVRQALQDALPQLREMLSSAGINLGQANVSDQSPKDPQQQAQPPLPIRTERDAAILRDGALSGTRPNATPIHRDNSTIDLFA